MWTLLKREIGENWGYLLTIILFAAGSIAYREFASVPGFRVTGNPIALSEFAQYASKNPVKADMLYPIGYVPVCLLLLAIGASRMVIDRTNGISTFFAGHLSTRGQVFTIRILMGFLLVVLFYLPVLCWVLWKLSQQTPLSPDFPAGKLIGMAIFLFLLSLTFYNLGLRMGQSNKKFIHLFGSICLGIMLLSFAILKGFDFEAIILLVVLNLALIYSAWQRYAAAAL
jgi:hypothetical protein